MTVDVVNIPGNGNLNLNRKPSPWRSFTGMGLLALGIWTALVSAPRAAAQREEATTVAAPLVMPQYSTLTSTDGTIQASRLPVTYNGNAYYVDLTLALTAEVSSKGVVTIAVAPTTVPSPVLTINNFQSGTYVGPSNIWSGEMEIVVSGPSSLPGGGTVWALSTATGAIYATYPETAGWYVEPITESPLAPRLSAAKITSPDYSYGLGDGAGYFPYWCSNSLLGFQQVGNSLTISDFTHPGSCTDSQTPVDSVTYLLKP